MFNISHSFTHLKALSCVLTGAMLVACSGGGAGDSNSEAPAATANTTTIQGSAIKGVVENGLVSAYRVINNAGVMEVSESALNGVVRTGSNGEFALELDSNLDDDTLVIEITADNRTRMTCDVTDGCGIDGSGSAILFGQQFALSSDFSMMGVVTGVNSGARIDANINPMTHMAVAYANANIEGLSETSINAAKRAVEEMLVLEDGALDGAAADITSLDTAPNDKASMELGLVSAAFLNLVNTPDWDGIEEVLQHIGERMASGGQLASVNAGALRDVTLDDIFNSANQIAEDLIAQNPDAAYAATMTELADETAAAYTNVVESAEQIDPVSIIAQPRSTDIDEGGNVTFSVGANGGGTLSFQWRKDGIAISGATNSSYTITTADLTDAGLYDVIVSNSVGAVTSNSALLGVAEVISLGSIALSWDIPTEREDGTELELYEIDGYVIAYGTASGELSNQLNIVGGGETEAVIAELEAGTYYFAIATVDSDGRQGNYSQEISQTIM